MKISLFVLFIAVMSANAFGQKSQTMTINVYFHNEKFNPNHEDCTKVFPTRRVIPRTKAVARAAMDELFKGTTDDERKNKFWSFPAEETKDIIRGLNVKNGVAFLNFKAIVLETFGNTTSSCGGGFYSSIEATLKQFPTIKKVIFAVEGNAEEFYSWVQVGDCPHGKKLCAKSNFQ